MLPLKAAAVLGEAVARLEQLPGHANLVIGGLLGEVHRLDDRIEQYDVQIEQIARQGDRARRLMRLPGIGPTTATAVVATIGNGHEFKSGR